MDTFLLSSIHDNPGSSTTDKSVYLNSILEDPAAESVAGLRLTAATNYEEAVTILQGRFDAIVEALLSLKAVTSQYNLRTGIEPTVHVT